MKEQKKKKITKKAVKEALSCVSGWTFAYNFKERPELIIFGFTSESRIKAALFAAGITVLQSVPYDPPRTGRITLSFSDNSNQECLQNAP